MSRRVFALFCAVALRWGLAVRGSASMLVLVALAACTEEHVAEERGAVTLDACAGCEPDSPAAELDAAVALDAGKADAGAAARLDAGGSDAARPRDAATTAHDANPLDARVEPPQDAADPPAMPADASASDAAPDVSVPQPDGSTPLPSGQTCGTTPPFPTPDACSKCICARCASQVAACYASDDAAKNAVCKSVHACAQANRCTGSACYCGTSLLCLAPDGPCVAVYQTAAGSTDPLALQAAFDDPENALGRANQIGTCQVANCATECGL